MPLQVPALKQYVKRPTIIYLGLVLAAPILTITMRMPLIALKE